MITSLGNHSVEQIYSILKNAHLSGTVPLGSLWSQQQIENELIQGHGAGIFLQPDRLVSFILYRSLPDGVEITNLATDPEYRRRGFMKQLVEELMRWNPNNIWLEVHEENLPARHLYRSIGFTEVSRRPGYYPDGGGACLLNWSL